MAERKSNYDIAKINARASFLECDLSDVKKHMPSVKEDETYYYCTFLSSELRIEKLTGAVDERPMGSDKEYVETDFNTVLTIYDIIGKSKDPIVMSQSFCTLNALNKVQAGSQPTLGNGFFTKFEQFCSENMDILSAALESYGGIKQKKGDVSYKINIVPEIEMIYEFWDKDDEFPPQIVYYFPQNILDFMHFETLWFLVSCINSRIMK